MKKTIYTLNIENYTPEITNITIPLIKYYANKINANYFEITERKFPDWPIAYEKFQIYELAKHHGNEWSIYIDIDTLVHPEMLDWSVFISKDTVLAGLNTIFANAIFTYDKYFCRDGRNAAICNWITMASDWCIDLWKPTELTLNECVNNIHLLAAQINGIKTRESLVDDYVISRNLAKYGLKYTTIKEQTNKHKEIVDVNFLAHLDNINTQEKIKLIRETAANWGLGKYIEQYKNA